jgi:hypothetical protein
MGGDARHAPNAVDFTRNYRCFGGLKAMSFALPFARSASNELSETRVSGLGLAAIAVFLFTPAAFAPQVLGDGDPWSHVATGEWIIAHGAAPRADPFSHSMSGAPWTAHEWLSEVLLALVLLRNFATLNPVVPSAPKRARRTRTQAPTTPPTGPRFETRSCASSSP